MRERIIFDGLLAVFALGSGAVKVIGIEVERQGAEQFGIDYRLIVVMGVLQIVSVPLIYQQYYLAAIALLGLPYTAFIYFGMVHQQYPLAFFSLAILGLTIFRWVRHILPGSTMSDELGYPR